MGRKRMLRQLAHSGRKCVWLIVAANPWYIIVRKMTRYRVKIPFGMKRFVPFCLRA
jgi:hypothetical protein